MSTPQCNGRSFGSYRRFPEFQSIAAFMATKEEDEDFDVHLWEVEALGYVLRMSNTKLIALLRSKGYSYIPREVQSAPRGFQSNPNTRWTDCK